VGKTAPRRRAVKSTSSVKGFATKITLATAAFCLAVCGGLFYLASSQGGSSPVAVPNPDWGGSSAPLPDKTFDENAEDSYKPPAAAVSVSLKPSSLSVPSLNIKAEIVAGARENGVITLPESSKVAEYTDASPISATEGSTVIAGHVNFEDGSAGALEPLHKVTKGTPVYATDASGKVHKYKVTKLDVLEKQAIPFDVFRTTGARQLVIVTCGGEAEKVNGVLAYTHNVVVTAEPVS
jgi:LPXTG-site transpeptidase (sortase) family protein